MLFFLIMLICLIFMIIIMNEKIFEIPQTHSSHSHHFILIDLFLIIFNHPLQDYLINLFIIQYFQLIKSILLFYLFILPISNLYHLMITYPFLEIKFDLFIQLEILHAKKFLLVLLH